MTEVNKHMGFKEDGHLDENAMATCSEWLNGKINTIDPVIRKHLESCLKCKGEVLEVSEIIYSIESDDTSRDKFEETCAARYSPSIKTSSSNQFWRVAAIMLVLIAVTVMAILIGPRNDSVMVDKLETENETDQENDTIEQVAPERVNDTTPDEIFKVESVEEDRYAGNFVPNPGLEVLIGARFRAGEKPSVISPPVDTTLLAGSNMAFRVKNIHEERLEIQIMDNKGKLVKSYDETGIVSQGVILDFSPGLYYWKLLGEEDLYQVGKFILMPGR